MNDALKIEDFKIKLYADGADIKSIRNLCEKPYIKGFTTNPTLMSQANVRSYKGFVQEVIALIEDKPISLEVISDNVDEMLQQGRTIASWGSNIFVKIPISTTTGDSTFGVIKKLTDEGIKVNVTAVMTVEQVKKTIEALNKTTSAIISIFAGRIADTGRDPVPMMKLAKKLISENDNIELLWASPRELLNIIHAESAGADIITITPDILAKLAKLNYDLNEFSKDTVKMFYRDAVSAKLAI